MNFLNFGGQPRIVLLGGKGGHNLCVQGFFYVSAMNVDLVILDSESFLSSN